MHRISKGSVAATVGAITFALMASTAALAGEPIPGVACPTGCIAKKPNAEKAGDTVAKQSKSDKSTADANGSTSSTPDLERKLGRHDILGGDDFHQQSNPQMGAGASGAKSVKPNGLPGSTPAPKPHALLPGGTTAAGAALTGMGSLSVPVVVVNKTGLVLSTNPMDLGYYYYSMAVTCQHSGMPAVTGHFGIPAGQHGTMPNIVTGSTCSVQEPPPPIPHGNSGCKLGPAAWSVAYSAPQVLVTGGHTSTITVTNTLLCKSDVAEQTQGQQQ